MNLLYLGYAVDDDTCLNNKGSSIAGNKMQVSILMELIKKNHSSFTISSIVPIAPYPISHNKIIKKNTRRINECLEVQIIPFFNFIYIKQISQVLNNLLFAFKWVKAYSTCENKLIYCYNYHPNVALPAIFLKYFYNCKIICILADPLIDLSDRKGLSKKMWLIMKKISEICIKKFDGIITVNKNSADKYAKGVPYIVVEGGVKVGDIDNLPLQKKNKDLNYAKKRNILFTGALYKYNGINLLIDAIKILNDDSIILTIYGDGPEKEYVNNEASKDARILYKGLVANSIVIQAQKDADLLINPRYVSDEISRYTFPSKLLEYMMSGTPVITTKLNGITEEYLPHLFIAERDTAECLAKEIKSAFKLERVELNEKGYKAREFIIKNKNWQIQGDKIHSFSKSLFDKKNIIG